MGGEGRRLGGALAVAALLFAAACGNVDDQDNSAQDGGDPPAVNEPADDSNVSEALLDESEPPLGDEGAGNVVTVLLDEDEIALSETHLEAGTYTFQVEGIGDEPHALVLEGDGVRLSAQAAGDSAEFTVTLEPGWYRLYEPTDDGEEPDTEVLIEVS